MTRTYGGKSSEERRAERRARVLDAALELYGTKGYRATSINEICAFGHVTTRHFYEEFESAENLLLQLYLDITAESSQAVAEAVVDAPLDPAARTRAGIGAFLGCVLGDERKGRIVGIEVIGAGEVLEAQRRENRLVFAEFLAAQAAELNPEAAANPEATRRMALVLVGGLAEIVIEQMHVADPTPIDILVDELASIFEAAVRIGMDEGPENAEPIGVT